MKSRRIAYSLIIIALVALIIASFPLYVCRDWAFICENTGSHKGYRQWTFGPKTGHWYKKSALEQFMETADPNALSHRWTSYSGTGKNIFGKSVLFGHGRPGAILNLPFDVLDQWVRYNKPEDIRQLYELLASDDQKKIYDRINEIFDEFSKYEN